MIVSGPVLTTAATYTGLGRDRCHSDDVIAVYDGLVSWKYPSLTNRRFLLFLFAFMVTEASVTSQMVHPSDLHPFSLCSCLIHTADHFGSRRPSYGHSSPPGVIVEK